MQFDEVSYGLAAASSSADPPSVPEAPRDPPPPDGSVDADSENDDEEPRNRVARLFRENKSTEHQRLHIPKNPCCEVCQRSRMYKRKTQSKRYDSLSSRGALPEVTKFGQRIACGVKGTD